MFTVAKYEPIGKTTMANVKARSLNMTPLGLMSDGMNNIGSYVRWNGRRNIGLLRSGGRERARIVLFENSFSLDMIRLDAMIDSEL